MPFVSETFVECNTNRVEKTWDVARRTLLVNPCGLRIQNLISFLFRGKLGGHFGTEKKYLAPPPSPKSPIRRRHPPGPSAPLPPGEPPPWDFQ